MSIATETFDDLIDRCTKYTPLDRPRLHETVKAVLRSSNSAASAALAELEKQWYASLPTPDYSVYAHHDYIAEMWGCWSIYSRKYLRNIQSDNSLNAKRGILSAMGKLNCVVDLGCGFGHTAAMWKEMAPDAEVIGTNIADTLQMKVAIDIGNEYGFTMLDELPACRADVLFASEYFEHIDQPIEHLFDVIKATSPQVMLIANAFGQKAIGHFLEYTVNNRQYRGEDMSKVFAFFMRKFGYRRVKTKMWNQRPAMWIKI